MPARWGLEPAASTAWASLRAARFSKHGSEPQGTASPLCRFQGRKHDLDAHRTCFNKLLNLSASCLKCSWAAWAVCVMGCLSLFSVGRCLFGARKAVWGERMSCSLRECHWSLNSSSLKPWIRGFRVSFLYSLGLKDNCWEQQLWHFSVQVRWKAKFVPKDKISTLPAGEKHWYNITSSNSEVIPHVITSPFLSFWNCLALGFLLLSRKTQHKEQSGSSPFGHPGQKCWQDSSWGLITSK